MKGAYDLHIHASPSIFKRWGDAEQTAEICQAAGMSGIVLKAHHGSTVEIANHLNGKFKLDIFGGVVLNYFVGGINPYAVDTCNALGGKVVWLPTIHAKAHQPLGRFEFQEPRTSKIPSKGIQITEGNDLVRPMYEIIEMLHDNKMILATGHISAKEIEILVRVVKEHSYNIKLLINHILFYTPALTEADIGILKNENIWFELSHFTQKIQKSQGENVADIIHLHPDANWIMVSDSGQKNNMAPQALQQFSDLLLAQGISQEELNRMMISNPKKLLD